jgi:hypothetical protein
MAMQLNGTSQYSFDGGTIFEARFPADSGATR